MLIHYYCITFPAFNPNKMINNNKTQTSSDVYHYKTVDTIIDSYFENSQNRMPEDGKIRNVFGRYAQ